MDNQHKLITGYRDLNAEEIAYMNKIKVHGYNLAELLKDLRGYPSADKRWIDIAETHLQQGIMAAVRAVARPDSF